MNKKRGIGDSSYDKNLEAFIDGIAKLEIDLSPLKQADIEDIEGLNITQVLYAICFFKAVKKEEDFDILKKLRLSSSFYKLMMKKLKEKGYFNKIIDLEAAYRASLNKGSEEQRDYNVLMHFFQGYDYIMYNHSDFDEEEIESLEKFKKACDEDPDGTDLQEEINENINKINETIKIYNQNIDKWSKSKNKNIITLLNLSDDMITSSHNLIKYIQALFFNMESQEMLVEDLFDFLDENNLMQKFDKFCKDKEKNDEY